MVKNNFGRKFFNFLDMWFMFVVIVLVLDFLCFISWAMSGQFPTDNFYLGAITRNVLQLIF